MGKILILGAGGHARVVDEVARLCGWEVLAFVERDDGGRREIGLGAGRALPIWPERTLETGSAPASSAFKGIALGLGDNLRRWKSYSRLIQCYELPVLVHPRGSVSASAQLGAGVVICAGAVVNPGAVLSEAALVNSGAIVEHGGTIGASAHVSPGAVVCGEAAVGHRAWIGAGAVVLPGIKIGAESVVGAGSVVLKDVPPACTVVGNPARILTAKASPHRVVGVG